MDSSKFKTSYHWYTPEESLKRFVVVRIEDENTHIERVLKDEDRIAWGLKPLPPKPEKKIIDHSGKVSEEKVI